MATGSRQGDSSPDESSGGATEPITLTDPDGAVTRVAPWSSWTREQVRAPGGEPALVTRLEQGQLWFSAGRRRSPWRHEVQVGPAVVSTPRGRFHAIAEADGGATIACLAGRTRVVAGLREPVLLGPDQSAAVSADGRTLVVMDRAAGGVGTPPDVIDLTEGFDEEAVALEAGTAVEGAGEAAPGRARTRRAAALAGVAAGPGLPPPSSAIEAPAELATPVGGDPPPSPELPYAEDHPPPARLGWIPELVAIAALLGVLVAAVWLLSRPAGEDELVVTTTTAMPAPTVAPTTAAPTTVAPTTLAPTTAAPTTAVPTTAPSTTAPPAASGATASGDLRSCRRAEGGVGAIVEVVHRSGPASRFTVTVALTDASGRAFAEGSATSERIEPGARADVEVLVRAPADAQGACEVVGVTGA